MKITIEAENQVPDKPQEWILSIRIDDKPQHKKRLTAAMANLPKNISVELLEALKKLAQG
jgi:hypothetical protein